MIKLQITQNALPSIYNEQEHLNIVKAYRVAVDLVDTIYQGPERFEKAYMEERKETQERFEDFGTCAFSNIIAQFWGGLLDARLKMKINPQAIAYLRPQLMASYALGVAVGDCVSDERFKNIEPVFDAFDKSRQEALKRFSY